MAQLTNDDHTAFKRAIRKEASARAGIRLISPSKQDLAAAFQGLEDWFEANRPAAKTAMEQASGLSLTPTLAKKLAKVYFTRKIGSE